MEDGKGAYLVEVNQARRQGAENPGERGRTFQNEVFEEIRILEVKGDGS